MSFIDQILDVGSSVWDWATGNSSSAGMARAAALAYMLKEVQDSINRDNNRDSAKGSSGASDTSESAPSRDYGVREQVDPNTENSIPIVYGSAFLGGSVIDAVMTNDNMTMWYAIALCEQTGIKMSDQLPSVITISKVYWNTSEIQFQSDGVTAELLKDEEGNSSNNISGLVRMYAYAGGSDKPVRIGGFGSAPLVDARTLMPGWGSTHGMPGLVFVLVRVDYAAEKQITGIGNLEFQLNNTMKMPGDCLYDYMTNTRYGAGIPPEEIKG